MKSELKQSPAPKKQPPSSKRRDQSRVVIQSPFLLKSRTLPLKLISPLFSSLLEVSGQIIAQIIQGESMSPKQVESSGLSLGLKSTLTSLKNEEVVAVFAIRSPEQAISHLSTLVLTHPVAHLCVKQKTHFFYLTAETMESLRKNLKLKHLLIVSVKESTPFARIYAGFRKQEARLEEWKAVANWEQMGPTLLPAQLQTQSPLRHKKY